MTSDATPTRPAPATTSAAAPTGPVALTHDVGLLVLRLALGLTMAAHGTQKLFGWFGGGGVDGTARFFGVSGYPSPKAFAVVAGLTETFGGLGIAVGLLTPLAAAAVLGTMLNALAVKGTGAFFAPAGIEYELLLAVGALGLALTGPGRLAVDRLLPALRTPRVSHRVGAVILGAVVAGITLLVRT